VTAPGPAELLGQIRDAASAVRDAHAANTAGANHLARLVDDLDRVLDPARRSFGWDGTPRLAHRLTPTGGMELRVPQDGSRWAGRVAFVPTGDLEELAEQGRWDSQSGQVLLLNDPVAAAALVAHGLAVQETRGGYHGTDRLRELLAREES
jgi:hypothetical protein